MLKKQTLLRSLLLIALPAAIISCGGEEPQEVPVQDTTVVEEVVEEEETVQNLLPSPLQVAMIFDKSGLEYDAAFTNKLDKASTYSTKFEKSINFGVYSADLAYAVLNEKTAEATQTIKVVRDLSTEIGLSTVFDSEDLLDRFERNINDEEAVLDILVEIEEKTDDYIQENGEHELEAVMFAGAWVEGMYIGVQSSSKNGNKELGAKLSEQMIILENLIKALSLGEADTDREAIATDLQSILDGYMAFDSVKGTEGDDAYAVELTEDEIKAFSEKIVALRNKIVKA